MPIIVRLDVMLAKRKAKSKDLADFVGITEANISLLKSGRVKGIRFATLEKICEFLDCQPGELLEFVPEEGRKGEGSAPAGRIRGSATPV
jgi:putative transcriptional regulator